MCSQNCRKQTECEQMVSRRKKERMNKWINNEFDRSALQNQLLSDVKRLSWKGIAKNVR